MARRSGHHRRTYHDGLTQRQREVLQQMALGKTNLEIAEDLGIGFESVKSHVSDILLRLDVSSREEAIMAWQEEGGVLSRLRRTATGFFVTGFGKAAVAGVVALVAVGVGAAIFVGGDGDSRAFSTLETPTRIVLPPQPDASPGNQTPISQGASPRTVIVVGNRNLDEVLDEASYFAGFVVSLPAWLPDGFRAQQISVEGPYPVDMREVTILLRRDDEPGAITLSLVVIGVDRLWPDEALEMKTGKPGVRAWKSLPAGKRAPTTRPFIATGGGLFVALTVPQILRDSPPPANVSEDDALRMLTSFFDVSPVLKPFGYPNGTPVATAVPTRTPDARDPAIFYAETATYDIESVLRAASGVAGFEAVLPGWLPAGWEVVAISASEQRFADPPKVDIHLAGDSNSIVVVSQWDRESLTPPSAFGLGVEVDFPRDGVEAVRFGEDGQRPFYFASGPGHTALIYDAIPAIGEEEALRILASIFEAGE